MFGVPTVLIALAVAPAECGGVFQRLCLLVWLAAGDVFQTFPCFAFLPLDKRATGVNESPLDAPPPPTSSTYLLFLAPKAVWLGRRGQRHGRREGRRKLFVFGHGHRGQGRREGRRKFFFLRRRRH